MCRTLHVQVNMKSSERLSIGRLAARFGLATHVLRHWEDVGLIEPAERVNGRRYYGDEHIARVTMIVRAKQAGLSLKQIADVLAAPDSSARRRLLRAHRDRLDEQIEQIEAAKTLLDHAIDCHAADFTTCLEFQDVARAAAPRTASALARTP
jgi:DNA-binding transcriptional MerR regulator